MSDWTPITKSLPPLDTWVEVIDAPYWNGYGATVAKRVIGSWCKDGWCWVFDDKVLILITHWRARPERP